MIAVLLSFLATFLRGIASDTIQWLLSQHDKVMPDPKPVLDRIETDSTSDDVLIGRFGGV